MHVNRTGSDRSGAPLCDRGSRPIAAEPADAPGADRPATHRSTSPAAQPSGLASFSTVSGFDARTATLPAIHMGPQLRVVRRGSETLTIDGRTLRLDADAYLVLGPGVQARAQRDAAQPAAGSVLRFGRAALGLARALGPVEPGLAPDTFLPTLRPHGDAVSRLYAQLERGLPHLDAAALEAQALLLMRSLIDAERRLREGAQSIASVKAATRRGLYRRVLVAADFMRSHYQQPLVLDDIASAACLSRFHLLRLFEPVYGMTPRAYLTHKRCTVALRLLAGPRIGLDEIAIQAGFGTRSSLFRHLRRDLGTGGQSIRADAAPRRRHLSVESLA